MNTFKTEAGSTIESTDSEVTLYAANGAEIDTQRITGGDEIGAANALAERNHDTVIWG